MISRRHFLIASAGAAATLIGGESAFANHKSDGTPQSQTRDRRQDGSGGGSPDGHPRNHGEISNRNQGLAPAGGTCPNGGTGTRPRNGQGGGPRN